MQLRHCCNHPFLIKGIIEAEGLNGADNETYLSNLVSASGKMLLLDKLLPHLQSEGHRVLLFSQFTMLLDLIEEYIDLKGFAYERLDGSVTGDKRQAECMWVWVHVCLAWLGLLCCFAAAAHTHTSSIGVRPRSTSPLVLRNRYGRKQSVNAFT